jgi:hypothetical protein
MMRHDSTFRLSPVPVGRAHRPTRGLFRRVKRISPGDRDSLAERGEFELPVPICEQSDDSIRLSFATSRRTAKRSSIYFVARLPYH